MTLNSTLAATLVARHRAWGADLRVAEMSIGEGAAGGVVVTNRDIRKGGIPLLPVSGEIHFSRVPRARWEERLRLMRSGGITAVAFYVIWIHHEPEQGAYRFDGDYDVRAFIELCEKVGLDVVLRVGPWVHGEVRNGGFPDWVQHSGAQVRTDDPAYLELVRTWFGRLGEEVAEHVRGDGPILAIQIENELYDQPAHISTLKRLALEAGLEAPVWTATGWGGAQLPAHDVLPLFGGYADGFWVDADAEWDDTFREHFFFRHVWDDPGIGADVRSRIGTPADSDIPRSASAEFPPATCELGGGMARAYHRRPAVGGRDVAAVALTKIGNGSAWQGFYMYAGGSNPRPDLEESHRTAYPNDLPVFDYDFNAPISATGRVRESHALLRRQHAFLAAFGAELAGMPSSLPDDQPADLNDRDCVRWAIRSDGDIAFVFIARHEPFRTFAPSEPTRFSVELPDETITFPHAPVVIPGGTLAHWPVNLPLNGAVIRWATASALTTLGGDGRVTMVLAAEHGIVPQVMLGESAAVEDLRGGSVGDDSVLTFFPEATGFARITTADGGFDLVVLPPGDGDRCWILEQPSGRSLVLADEEVWVDADGLLAGRAADVQRAVRRWDVEARAFVPVPIELEHDPFSALVESRIARSARSVPPAYGEFDGRASAPDFVTRAELAELVSLTLPDFTAASDLELEVEWAGDVLELLVDGVPVADQFWAGQEFVVNLRDHQIRPSSEVTLRVLPLHPDAAVGVPSAAREERRAVPGQLMRIGPVRLVERVRWIEHAHG